MSDPVKIAIVGAGFGSKVALPAYAELDELEPVAMWSRRPERARELSEQGVPVGILDSDDYASLTPGRFIVFSGQYTSRRQAQDALAGIGATTEGAYVQRVAPE